MRILFFSFLILGLLSCDKTASNSSETTLIVEKTNVISYDSALAIESGADDYGMRTYVLAYLKRGPNRELSEEESTKLQRAHLDNIKKLAKMGKLIVAGPFLDDGDIRGIYIFAVDNMNEAEVLTKTDPAIIAGSLEMELHPWYGPASLVLMEEVQKKLSKKSI